MVGCSKSAIPPKLLRKVSMNKLHEKQGALALSAIICGIMIVAAVNGAFFKNAVVTQLLWISFGVWVVLFFVYCLARLVSGHRKVNGDNWSSNVGDILKIYD